MSRRIYARTVPPVLKRGQKQRPPAETSRAGRILVHMESEDPRLLDKEARNLYERLTHSGAHLIGPVPIPIRMHRDARCPETASTIHRRFFDILHSTEETISVLEKLPISQHISISFEVEEEVLSV